MAEAILAIQSFRQGGLAVQFDLAPIHVAEQRIHEITFADKRRAKDLFSEFIRAYIHAVKLHAMAKLHVARATNAARQRRAVLLLDHIPTLAKEKGLTSSRNATGSADVREAFYYTDPEYNRIEEFRASIEAAQELLFGKLMALRDASDACKAMLSPDEVPRGSNASIAPTAHGTDECPDPMGAKDPEPEDDSGFGKPGH